MGSSQEPTFTLTMTTTYILVLLLSAFQPFNCQSTVDFCTGLLQRKNLQAYADIVAHLTHSLTLNDIRSFFKADADENNGIPMVNFDLTSDQLVLLNAPLIDSRFSFPAMFALDHVLSNMDDESYDLKGLSAMDSLAHNLHQQETWARAAKIYKRKAKSNAKHMTLRTTLCTCLKDNFDDLILEHLEEVAEYIRKEQHEHEHDRTAHGDHGEELPPSIMNEASWMTWKEMTYANITEEIEKEWARNVAHYINCKLNF